MGIGMKYILIGSNSTMAIDFAKYLDDLGFIVIGVSNGNNINPYLQQFHCATNPEIYELLSSIIEGATIVYFAWRSPNRTNRGLETYSENLSIYDLQNYLSLVPLLNANKFVFISSAGAIYGSSNSMNFEDSPLLPVTKYGKEKLEAELLLSQSIPEDKLLVCRVTNPYGFYIPPKKGIGFVDRALFTALDEGFVNVFGSGVIERDYIHIQDVCMAIFDLVELNLSGVFNISSGMHFKIIDLARHIQQRVKNCQIRIINVQESPIKTCKVSNNKLINFAPLKLSNLYNYIDDYIET